MLRCLAPSPSVHWNPIAESSKYSSAARGIRLPSSYRSKILHSVCSPEPSTSAQRKVCARAGTFQKFQSGSSTDSVSQIQDSRAAEATEQSTAYDTFDWMQQWYPVGFIRDFPTGETREFSLFDESYVIARRAEGGPVAMQNRCPHRGAALSEGLVTPEGALQCAYHGWKFDGKSGQCLQVPQLQTGTQLSKRTSGTALPIREYQGILWMRPTSDPADFESNPTAQLPGIVELDKEGWTSDDFVRDFPIDYSLLLENLADPDHGLFAHQVSYFDSYTADATYPLSLKTGSRNGRPHIQSQVAGVLKYTNKNTGDGSTKQQKAMFSEKEKSAAAMRATIDFEGPSFLRWSRFDSEGNTTFITAFYAVPTGVGRSRLMIRYARSIVPWFRVPTWAFSIALNSFLDQDSMLLASQQPYTLEAEMQAHMAEDRDDKQHAQDGAGHSGIAESDAASQATFPAQRRKLFCYRAPTEKLLIEIGKWIDAAVPRMPNRKQLLLQAHSAGGTAAGIIGTPKREDVLDRWAGHTEICPASKRAYERFLLARNGLASAAAIGATVLLSYVFSMSATGGAWGTQQWAAAAAILAAAGIAKACDTVSKQFSYVYTPEKLRKDLAKIPDLTKHLTP